MYSNVRGLKSKLSGLKEVMYDHNPHIFLLTETQLNSDTGVTIKGYTLFSKIRNSSGGGVSILVRNDVTKHVAPHISERDIELIWISVRKKGTKPIFIGSYYGKQESRTTNEEIQREMNLLEEEITEMQKEGEIFLGMDGNAKLGILGENISRNGKFLNRLIDNTKLTLMNTHSKCQGKVTRKNTNNQNEFSAIDFILTSESVANSIEQMVIDEDGLATIRGKKDTDHNTIISTLVMNNIDHSYIVKRTNWNLKASSEKWAQFSDELAKRQMMTSNIINCKNIPLNHRYNLWTKEIENAARETIGKTTVKYGGKEKFSNVVTALCKQKRDTKTLISQQTNINEKYRLIGTYKVIQLQIREQMTTEKAEYIENKFKMIVADRSQSTFWKEKKKLTKNPVLESLIIKDENGRRLFSPEEIKEGTARYYQDLYAKKPIMSRPYHTWVENSMIAHSNNYDFDNLPYNSTPSIHEISDIVANKKNGKSTSDFPNEFLKRPGVVMESILYPLIEAIWEEEKVPDKWNKGIITSLWKGKGDKELLKNHRGITVSSSIGSILEELLDNRIEQLVPLTQAQGGGKKQSSTCDHLFLLRAMMTISLKQKRQTFITFFDVAKAYDHVDNNDLLSVMWEKGLRGKSWRLLNELNKNLKATVKTKYGETNEIDMDIGGRQGSRLTGRMFAKMMDLLAEEVIASGEGFNLTKDFMIGILLWIDDVISCVEGVENQKNMLERVDRFAKDHKLKWGAQKCKVMRLNNLEGSAEWDLGDTKMQECESYTYLGDKITNDGKNTENIKLRKNKINISTVSINTIASSEALYKIETAVLLQLHEKVNISSLITNSESWTLLKGEQKELESAEIQCLKNMFSLPINTPTPGIIYTFGTLYTNVRIDQRRLNYLHKILSRGSSHWTRQTLESLKELNLGWYKGIQQTLSDYNLSQEFHEISSYSMIEWKSKVKKSIEERNKNRLHEDCHKKENGTLSKKSKTAHIIDMIENPSYQRKPLGEIVQLTKQETKTLIIARFRMLECGRNFKGTMKEICDTCGCADDEEHRLNSCIKFVDINYHDNIDKISFETIFSRDPDTLRLIINRVAKVWNVCTGNGSMNFS